MIGIVDSVISEIFGWTSPETHAKCGWCGAQHHIGAQYCPNVHGQRRHEPEADETFLKGWRPAEDEGEP